MRVIKLKSYNSSNLAGGLLCVAALLSPWLSSLSGWWMLVAGITVAVVFVLVLEDGRALSCRRLLISRKGLLAINYNHTWHTVSHWQLLRLFVHCIELSVQTEGRQGKRRLRLSRSSIANPDDYAILRHYLLSASQHQLHEQSHRYNS